MKERETQGEDGGGDATRPGEGEQNAGESDKGKDREKR